MIKKIISWIKNNKIASLAIAALIVILSSRTRSSINNSRISPMYDSSMEMASFGKSRSAPAPQMMEGKSYETDDYESNTPNSAPATERMVVRSSNLSIKVKDVEGSIKEIDSLAGQHGGFLVNSNLNKYDSKSNGTIQVRIDSSKLDSFLESVKGLGVKVVSENVSGRDITDQFTDLEERLRIVTKTKTKFEGIFDQATKVQEMLNVQREILNIQRQIDSIKGQIKYMEKTSSLSMVSIHLSTDELELPISGKDSWRPSVIFREATRSLVELLRSVAEKAIWMVVFTPIWGLALLAIYIYKKVRKTKKSNYREQIN